MVYAPFPDASNRLVGVDFLPVYYTIHQDIPTPFKLKAVHRVRPCYTDTTTLLLNVESENVLPHSLLKDLYVEGVDGVSQNGYGVGLCEDIRERVGPSWNVTTTTTTTNVATPLDGLKGSGGVVEIGRGLLRAYIEGLHSSERITRMGLGGLLERVLTGVGGSEGNEWVGGWNESVGREVRGWLEAWKKGDEEDVKDKRRGRSTVKGRRRKTRRIIDSESEESGEVDYDVSDDDDNGSGVEAENGGSGVGRGTYLRVIGPVGCGKTSTVLQAASQMGYDVIEIHAGLKRSGKELAGLLTEATRSHTVTGDGILGSLASISQFNHASLAEIETCKEENVDEIVPDPPKPKVSAKEGFAALFSVKKTKPAAEVAKNNDAISTASESIEDTHSKSEKSTDQQVSVSSEITQAPVIASKKKPQPTGQPKDAFQLLFQSSKKSSEPAQQATKPTKKRKDSQTAAECVEAKGVEDASEELSNVKSKKLKRTGAATYRNRKRAQPKGDDEDAGAQESDSDDNGESKKNSMKSTKRKPAQASTIKLQPHQNQHKDTPVSETPDVIDVDSIEDQPMVVTDKKERHRSNRHTLVLIEDSESLFEEDKGYWTALSLLMENSKRPIVFTCLGISLHTRHFKPKPQLFKSKK
jgi:hypothetical protein